MGNLISQPRYLTLEGKSTTSTDLQRGIWYSANCRYWTDDWSKLAKVGPGIPVCPHCKTPGFQTTADKWTSDLLPPKEQCQPPSLTSWLGNAS